MPKFETTVKPSLFIVSVLMHAFTDQNLIKNIREHGEPTDHQFLVELLCSVACECPGMDELELKHFQMMSNCLGPMMTMIANAEE